MNALVLMISNNRAFGASMMRCHSETNTRSGLNWLALLLAKLWMAHVSREKRGFSVLLFCKRHFSSERRFGAGIVIKNAGAVSGSYV